jgi:hypothetical protein
MEDQLSSQREVSHTSDASPSSIPPWEVRTVSQVPYLGRSPTPPTTTSELQHYHDSRPPRAGSESHTKPRLVSTNSAPSRSEYSSPVSQSAKGIPWSKRRHTSAFPPPQLGPAPYETPLDLPAEAEKMRHRSFMTPANSPPSPPDSPSSCNKSDTSVYRDPPAQALPGTMSSRASRIRGHSQTQSKTLDQTATTGSQSEHRPISKRLTNAFRGMFKKEPVDESGFEHISDRHWTEEF